LAAPGIISAVQVRLLIDTLSLLLGFTIMKKFRRGPKEDTMQIELLKLVSKTPKLTFDEFCAVHNLKDVTVKRQLRLENLTFDFSKMAIANAYAISCLSLDKQESFVELAKVEEPKVFVPKIRDIVRLQKV